MNVSLAAVAFVPGLAIGSFLNVVAARVPRKRSIVRPGSACMSCGEELAWYDNVPVLSYLALRGRCRGCGTAIGLVYPAVELLTALLVAASFLAFGWSGKAFVASFFCAVLVTISATDFSHRIVPNVVVLPAAVVVLVAMTALEPSVEWALGAFGASSFLFLAALAYPKGMGMGDVKLALLLGAMLGRTAPVGLMVGMLAALVPSIVLLARHGVAARKMKIPFAPFLSFGGLVALFFGEDLLDAYLTAF
jgi:leader peptidase (prepilin peptidase)/N-methyltransferase